jgi:hypothetical protein
MVKPRESDGIYKRKRNKQLCFVEAITVMSGVIRLISVSPGTSGANALGKRVTSLGRKFLKTFISRMKLQNTV